MQIFWSLRWFFQKEWLAYSVGIGILMLVSALALLPPYAAGRVVDQIAEGTLTVGDLQYWAVLLLGAGILMYIFRYIWRIMIFGAAIRLAKLLRSRLYEHYTKMSASFYNRRRTGDLMAHSTNDIKAVEQTAGIGVLTLVDSIAMGGFVIAAMAFTISWQLTLLCLLPMPLMAAATSIYGNILHHRFGQAQAAFSELNNKVQESVSGIRVTKAFGQEKAEVAAFSRQSDKVVEKNENVARVDALFEPTISLVVGISYFLAVFFGARFVIAGDLTIGELTSFTVYLGMLTWPMLAFGLLFNIVERGRASYGRIESLLEEKQDITDERAEYSSIPTGSINVVIESCHYPEAEQASLQDISFYVQKGETIGIAGRTGSGKTTLLKLLLREMEDPLSRIEVDGVSAASYQLDSYRMAFGYVPQDHFLFSISIADNIAFARPDASFKEIVHAAKTAHVHEDIINMEYGYDTIVGERGVTLSGGQKQRLAIARALITDPEILILDDSLSAVDAKTEESILSHLQRERHNKTTWIVSHRMSAIKHADQIVVLENGRQIERGTHDELMKDHRWYADMYDMQQLESLVEKGGKDGAPG
ncbi:ATP-binding cassette subfamily B protein [Sinobaca qinghaiensis]|uniref:ATP-binding cassette subfamily B protein n=1 Tax=Sinobaca qinghaiensis TaxID=342944 RepID=A0A419V5V7_9BACL|nr:ABC transporter transmembrane domain-containing protein [Sinobaca qinghaiensis]RKD75277.1 ATP-binding cassette subfamily B protein [Sinobaca qinghaiensis]